MIDNSNVTALKEIMANNNINCLEHPLIIPPILPEEFFKKPCAIERAYCYAPNLYESEKKRLNFFAIQIQNMQLVSCLDKDFILNLARETLWHAVDQIFICKFDKMHSQLLLFKSPKKDGFSSEYTLMFFRKETPESETIYFRLT